MWNYTECVTPTVSEREMLDLFRLDFRDVTLQAIVDFSTQLDAALDGLTPKQWRWRRTPKANHIMWTVWHLIRIEDMWINWYLSDNGERWKTRGWAEKFGMPPGDRYGV